VETGPTPNIITLAVRPASNAREIPESLCSDVTVSASAYSGAGSRITLACSCSAQRAVQLDDRLTPRRHGGKRPGDRDDLGAPGEAERVRFTEPPDQEPGRRAAHRCPCRRVVEGPGLVDAAANDDGLGEAERMLECRFLVGVQVVALIGRHHDLDANEALRLGPRDQPAGRRAGNAQPFGDFGLGQPVEVVQRRGAQREPQVLGCGAGGRDWVSIHCRARHGTSSDIP
jgi:hypothetical protein